MFYLLIISIKQFQIIQNHYIYASNIVDRRRFVIKSDNKRNALSAAAAEAAGEERAPESAEGEPSKNSQEVGVEKVIVEVFELQKYIKNKLTNKKQAAKFIFL